MPRLIRMSTQVGDSAANARRALDHSIDLKPIAPLLHSRGVALAPDGRGFLWGFKARSPVITAPQPLAAGDVALRVEKVGGVAHITSAYVVSHVALDDPSLPRRVGIHWQGDGGWSNSVVFGSRITPRRVFPYTDYMDAFGWVTGFNYKADFLSVPDFDTFLEEFAAGVQPSRHAVPSPALQPPMAGAPQPLGPAPTHIAIDNDHGKPWPQPGTSTRPIRGEQAAFRAEVLRAYADPKTGTVRCAACDVEDDAIIEAAHVVDYGRGPDRWYNGLPLCRNHHRYFDLWLLRLGADYRWHAGDDGPSLARMGVTKAGLSHLDTPGRTPRPHAEAVRWKWALSSGGPQAGSGA